MTERRQVTITIVKAPYGGYVVFDGRSEECPLMMSKSTLSELTHALSDLIGQYFLPDAPDDHEEVIDMPRVAQRSDGENVIRPGFFKRMMGGR